MLNADCIQVLQSELSIGVHIFKNVFSDSYYMWQIKCLCAALYTKINKY